MYEHLEHFGKILMVDGKVIQSFGTKINKDNKSGERGGGKEHQYQYINLVY